MKIVVVEDEIRIREGISRLLGKLKQGYEMEGEAEIEQGLELIRRVKPDVVITDIKMPKMDGFEMLKIMYREGIQAKAIVLSAYSEFEYARKAMSMGVTEYLLKPVTFGDCPGIDACTAADWKRKPSAGRYGKFWSRSFREYCREH